MGGSQALRKIADDPVTSVLELRFRPKDRFEHPIASCTAKTNNLLIRMRKHQDEEGAVRVHHEPVAAIRYSIRFRDMSDFQWNTSKSSFCARMKGPLSTRDAKILTDFTLSREQSSYTEDLDLMPPPIFSTTVVPHTYNYVQNPAAKKVQTATGPKLVNQTRGLRQHLITMAFDDGPVPISPSAKLPAKPNAEIEAIVFKLTDIFAERPMWTRRGLMNRLDQTTNFYNIKFALPYISYMWKSGPWRDCYARFGIDPRKDSTYADYQAIYCMSKVAITTSDASPVISSSHVFDGKTLYPQGRTFMFCDMTDPILVQIRERAVKRDKPHPRDGWWRAKMVQSTRNILRGKLTSLCAGKIPSDLDFASILESANDPDDHNDDEKIHESSDNEMIDPDLEEDAEENVEDVEETDMQTQTLVASLVRPGENFKNIHNLRDAEDDTQSNAELEEGDDELVDD